MKTSLLVLSFMSVGCSVKPISLPPSSGDLAIQRFPENTAGSKYFDRFLTAFGVYVLVAEQVSEQDALHATHVLAQYLDNDENGEPDEPLVVEEMVKANSALILFETQRDLQRSRIFFGPALNDLNAQDLYGREILPPDSFDATLEEVLHLVTHVGYSKAFPADYDEDGPSTLTNAMDIARGGHFEDIPNSYPDEGWYHYDDFTCDYNCMATEYLYWAMTSLLGAQADRCSEIEHEWELCTPESVEGTDSAVVDLLRNGPFKTPEVLPDGSYGD